MTDASKATWKVVLTALLSFLGAIIGTVFGA